MDAKPFEPRNDQERVWELVDKYDAATSEGEKRYYALAVTYVVRKQKIDLHEKLGLR